MVGWGGLEMNREARVGYGQARTGSSIFLYLDLPRTKRLRN